MPRTNFRHILLWENKRQCLGEDLHHHKRYQVYYYSREGGVEPSIVFVSYIPSDSKFNFQTDRNKILYPEGLHILTSKFGVDFLANFY